MPDQPVQRSLAERYTTEGHPSVEDLIADQGLAFPRDPRDLLGNFWPEDESIEDFLAALHDWRGHQKSAPAA